ncbi:MAG: bifunctional DNA-formamidopyrimidine glycosylase/DNA-(apurinic or apyrimidinic site) lyase [Caldilineae bacterium]|nr:MAG: bifunctional DNA-formamidopyrimidine glycosylase/DNA-(apurinic or apyrimidinic site) lyase [Caldilineae bacterium]
MPELPEVETYVRDLQRPLVGRTFTGVMAMWPNAIRPSVAVLRRDLPGRRIEALTRRGKYLQFHLSGEMYLFLHLKMSGRLLVEPAAVPPNRHVRTIFRLDNGHELRFEDARKFGRVHLVTDPDEVTGHLGPEPLADDFTPQRFAALLEGRRGQLKPLLLNQAFIAGIGNIYADESCFRAGLHPRRRADTLSPAEQTRLYHAIRQSLTAGITHRGATFDAVYRGGEFQNHFQVYGRKGKPCPRCGTPIERIVVGGRGTHFCPRCQPEPAPASAA